MIRIRKRMEWRLVNQLLWEKMEERWQSDMLWYHLNKILKKWFSRERNKHLLTSFFLDLFIFFSSCFHSNLVNPFRTILLLSEMLRLKISCYFQLWIFINGRYMDGINYVVEAVYKGERISYSGGNLSISYTISLWEKWVNGREWN